MMMNCPLCASTFTAPVLPGAPPPPRQPAPAPPPPKSTAPPGGASSAPAPASGTPPAQVPTEHSGRFSLWISPRYTQFVPAAALFLILVLSFFPWAVISPGGVTLDSQSGFQAMVGSSSTGDRDLRDLSWVHGKQREAAVPSPMAGEANNLSFGMVTFLYLALATLNLLVAVAAAGRRMPRSFCRQW